MPKKRHNVLCHCHKTGAWRSRSAAESALEKVQESHARKPLHFSGYVPIAVTPCRSKSGVWHLTSKTEKPLRGQRRGPGWARNR
jgi:hypothetical protein